MRLNLLVIVLQFVHLKPAQKLQKPKKMVRNHIYSWHTYFKVIKKSVCSLLISFFYRTLLDARQRTVCPEPRASITCN